MAAYYNEIDPYAAQWLRNLIQAEHIAPGEVDDRSIEGVRPDDLRGFTQCHFFAGIGGWSYALRLAGWPDERPVWTGSCPCQPFSAAGKGAGFADERHLWPLWHYLIEECRPAVVFGEQVEAAIRLRWLDLVQADMEGLGYAFGAAGLPAACVGAPHIRQRLWFVAHAERGAAERRGFDLGSAARDAEGQARERERVRADAGAGDDAGLVAHSSSTRLEGRDGRALGRERAALERGGGADGLEHAHGDGRQQRGPESGGWGTAGGCGSGFVADLQIYGRWQGLRHIEERPGLAEHGPWHDLEWLPCRDGKARPTQPGLQPLAHGVQNRVGRLRAYGNAIVPQVAAAFVEEAMRCMP